MRGHLKSAMIGVDNSEPPGMSLQFRQPVENMDVWSASSGDISFVITFASPTGPGFHGRRGFFASWRPLYSRTGAVKVTGSPFSTFEGAKAACNTMLGTLEAADPKNR
jgi:hypothetical protein